MTTLRVIQGGRTEAGAMCRPSDSANASLRARVRRAEKDAHRIAQLMAPAVATIGKTEVDLVQMIKASGFKEATATRAAFREAADAAHGLAEVLRTAETKLFNATTALLREELGGEAQ